MEKLHTVEDIANMTMLTTRTIRNYLKDGTLTGRKIGGQWRFTDEDIMNLMKSGDYVTEHLSNLRQNVLDFVDGVNDYVRGEVQGCAIVDFYSDEAVVKEKLDRLLDFINSDKEAPNNYMSFSCERIEREDKSRVVIFANPKYLAEALKILE